MDAEQDVRVLVGREGLHCRIIASRIGARTARLATRRAADHARQDTAAVTFASISAAGRRRYLFLPALGASRPVLRGVALTVTTGFCARVRRSAGAGWAACFALDTGFFARFDAGFSAGDS